MGDKKISESAVLLIIGKTIQAVSGFVLLLFFVRILDKDVFASYQLYVLVAMTLAIFMSAGLPQSYYYFLPKLSKQQQKGFIIETMKSQFFIYMVFSCIVLIMALYFEVESLKDRFYFGLILLSSVVLFVLYETLLSILISLKKGDVSAGISVLFGVMYLIVQLIVVYFYRNAEIIYLSLISVYGITLLYGMRVLSKHYNGVSNSSSGITIKQRFAYALPLWGSYAIGQINRRLDSLLIASFFTASVFATYNVGAREIPLIGIISYNLTQIIMPKLVEYHNSGQVNHFIKIWHKSVSVSAYLTYPVFFALFLFSGEVIRLLYTDAYSDAAEVFRVYLILILFRVTVYGQVVSATGKTKSVFKGVILCFVINIIFSVGMLDYIGWVAPAYGTVLAQVILIVYLLNQVTKELSIPFRRILPYKKLILTALISLIFAGITYKIYHLYYDGFFVLGILMCFYFLIYLITIWMVGIIEDQEKQMAYSYYKKIFN